MATTLLLGGDVLDWGMRFAIIVAAGTALVVVAILARAETGWKRLSVPARIAVIILVALPWLQLIPLPPAIWQQLPGRDLATAVLDATGSGAAWRATTLSIPDTLQAAILSLPALALLLATLSLDAERQRGLFAAIAVLATVHIVLALLPILARGSMPPLYPQSAHAGFAIGLFSNKNHSALFIAIAIIALVRARPHALALDMRWWGAGAVFVTIWLAALVLANSRAGIGLGLLAAIVAIALIVAQRRSLAAAKPQGRRGQRPGRGRGAGRILAIVATVALLGLAIAVFTSSAGSRAIARFGIVGEDIRLDTWRNSWTLLVEMFPIGAGIGTYAPIYTANETLAALTPTFRNHVHNDYIEWVFETGALGLAGLLLLIGAGLSAGWQAWRGRSLRGARDRLAAAAIVALFALHSLPDYPVRRIGLLSVLIVCAAILLRRPASEETELRRRARYARQARPREAIPDAGS